MHDQCQGEHKHMPVRPSFHLFLYGENGDEVPYQFHLQNAFLLLMREVVDIVSCIEFGIRHSSASV